MGTPRQSKSHLSKNLLQMKFMQRSAIRVQKEDYEAEQQKYVDDEHWKLDLPELAQKESKYVFEPSFVHCEELRFGRVSFKGFNPEIEKINLSQQQELELDRAAKREQEISVGDEEMANRYSSLIGTIGKAFSKKRHRSQKLQEDDGSEDGEIVEDIQTPSGNKKLKTGKTKAKGRERT